MVAQTEHTLLAERRKIDAFKKAARNLTKQATSSKTAARRLLVEEGILTKKRGELTKNYK